jgi:hypothetical protein
MRVIQVREYALEHLVRYGSADLPISCTRVERSSTVRSSVMVDVVVVDLRPYIPRDASQAGQVDRRGTLLVGVARRCPTVRTTKLDRARIIILSIDDAGVFGFLCKLLECALVSPCRFSLDLDFVAAEEGCDPI